MYELKKMERYLRVNLSGPGPRLMKKEFTRPRSHKGRETLLWSHKPESWTVAPVTHIPAYLPTRIRMVCTLWTINRIVLYVTADHSLFGRVVMSAGWHRMVTFGMNTIPNLCLAHNSITVRYLTARAIYWSHPYHYPRCNTGLNPALRRH